MKESMGRLTIKKVANVSNSNNANVYVGSFFIVRKLDIKREKAVTKSSRTYAKKQLKLRHLQ